MTPGKIFVFKCPNCSNLLRKGSLNSGNTLGEKLFSDSKRIAPMLPEFPTITKCKKCNTIFWLSKLEEIGTFYDDEIVDPEWQAARKAEFLNIDDYYSALNSGIVENKEEEFFIRNRIWWAYNDRIRNGLKIFNDENDEIHWKENVNELMYLLDQSDPDQRLMKAEMYRNLGEFDNCSIVLQNIDEDDLNWVKEKLANECERKNKWVIQLN